MTEDAPPPIHALAPHVAPDQPDPDIAARHMLEALVCPLTGATLSYDAAAGELVSQKAGLAFPIRSGIPIMLIDEARRLDDRD